MAIDIADPGEAAKRLRLLDGSVLSAKHFRQELANDRCSLADAWMVLGTGRIYDPCEIDIRDRRVEVAN